MSSALRTIFVFLFLIPGMSGTVEAQSDYDPDPESIQYIYQNQDAYIGRSVELPPAYVRTIEATSDSETRSFTVQDEAGTGILVFTTGELPQVDNPYRIAGTVELREGSQTPYVFASTIEGPLNGNGPPIWVYYAIGGLLVAILVLGVYVVQNRDSSPEVAPPEIVDLQGPEMVESGEEAGFTVRANHDATPVDYQWHFGDGTVKEGQTVTHFFDSSGSYTVMVTARNEAGEDSRTMSVNVPKKGPVGHQGQREETETSRQPDGGEKTKVIDTDQVETTVRSKKTVKMLGWFDVLSGHDDTKIPLNVPVGGDGGSAVAGHEYTIGRKSASEQDKFDHIRLKPRTVSREQAKLSFVNGSFRLTNYVPDSKNPTIVDGTVLDEGQQVELSDGDTVTMGEVKLQLQLHSSTRA
jgi:PKD repeat protein